MGAPPLLPSETTADALGLAIHEFASGITPMGVSRFRDAFD
jgi:hypothetical protein